MAATDTLTDKAIKAAVVAGRLSASATAVACTGCQVDLDVHADVEDFG